MVNVRLALVMSGLLCWVEGENIAEDVQGTFLLQQKQELGKRILSRSFDSKRLSAKWKPWAKDQKMKVIYGVFTSPQPKYARQLQAVEETWAKQVPPQRLLVVGVNGSNPDITYKPAPLCQEGHINNPGISCKEATLLSTGYELGADWVVVIGSDNYVFPRRFDEVLEHADKKIPQILAIWGCGGGKFCKDHKSGHCGGGGYAISRAALDAMVGQGVDAGQRFIQESMHQAATVGGGWSDQVTSCIARRHGVKEVPLKGLYGWKLCESGNFSCPFNEAAYREHALYDDPKALTFHYITPLYMHRIHDIVQNSDMGDEGTATKMNLLTTSTTEYDYYAARDAYIRMVDKKRARHGFAPNKTSKVH